MFYLLASTQLQRTLLLCPDRHDKRLPALELQRVDPLSTELKVQARFQAKNAADLGLYKPLTQSAVFGCLGVINVLDDAFMIVVTEATEMNQLNGSKIYNVRQVECFSITSDKYDILSTLDSAHQQSTAYMDQDMTISPVMAQHPCAGLVKLLSMGTFYFSDGGFDLSRTLQYSYTTSNPAPERQYVWNYPLIENLQRVLDSSAQVTDIETTGLLISIIQGYVGIMKMYNGKEPFSMAVISRVNSRRAGTRYNTRGIDDQGAVANFVETEMIYYYRHLTFSHVQVRGSVPIFWDQPGLQVKGHKIQISRAADATRPAFERHIQDLMNCYGNVYIVNLLSHHGGGEEELRYEYRQQVNKCRMTNDIRMIEFDFHAECKGTNYAPLGLLMNSLRTAIETIGCFVFNSQTQEVLLTQHGIIRTNCVDCLDRTNVVQGLLAEKSLESFKVYDDSLRYFFTSEEYLINFKTLWADNGDHLSLIYAGTGALKSGFTRSGKRTLAGLLDDSMKSVNRFVINNFQDKSRQMFIDQLLGRGENQRDVIVYDPGLEAVRQHVDSRSREYTSYRDLILHVGTYNVNGKLPIDANGTFKESLQPWLSFTEVSTSPDLFVIGFQEIVELTPNQIVAADPWKRQQWQQALVNTVNSGNTQYVLVRDGQLVGAAIFIYAKADLAPHIRAVEMCIKKTGLRGMTGNKGGISVRLDVFDSSFCFVTAHFAAGTINFEERNRDYHTINNETIFKRGKRIQDHECVIWLGDFNYRLDLDNEECRVLIGNRDLQSLLPRDQLLGQMNIGAAFAGFKEGNINFMPTYKFNNGTDRYDTSEKNRVPSWCDRILYYGQNITLLGYNRAELKVSDHKPMKGLFRVKCTVIDHLKKTKITEDAYGKKGDLAIKGSPTSIRSTISQSTTASSNPFVIQPQENKLIDFNNELQSHVQLPPPSSVSQQWWNNSGASAYRSTTSPQQSQLHMQPKQIPLDHSTVTGTAWTTFPSSQLLQSRTLLQPHSPPQHQQVPMLVKDLSKVKLTGGTTLMD